VRYEHNPNNNYLAHHGIKGQKWGVRRFQNPDGTLTDAGKARYRKENDFALEVLAVETIGSLAFAGVVAAAAGINAQAAKNLEKRILKHREEEPIDEKTGLHLKDKEMTSKEDAKVTNLGRRRVNSEILEGSSHNCALCSAAYDLRRRGFDVMAERSGSGFTDSEITSWYKNAEPKPMSGRDERGLASTSALIKQYKEAMLSGGPGSRGIVTVGWKGTFSGHAMSYEVDKNGNLSIVDAQSATIYSKQSIDSLLSRCSYDCGMVLRTDNIEPDWDKIKQTYR